MMTFPTHDMVEAILSDGCIDLHVSYPRHADIDGTFAAFCHDTQERIEVNGWLIADIQLIED